MKVYVNVGGREFTVELDGNRAVVREGDDEHAVSTTCSITSPDAWNGLSEGPEVLVAREDSGDPATRASPVHVAFWGQGGGPHPERTLRLLVRGRPIEATLETERDRLRARLSPVPRTEERMLVRSPLPGVIRQIFLFPGNQVREGEPIMTLEAMKMENEIRAEADGVLEALHVEEGQVVNTGDRLCEIRTSDGASA